MSHGPYSEAHSGQCDGPERVTYIFRYAGKFSGVRHSKGRVLEKKEKSLRAYNII